MMRCMPKLVRLVPLSAAIPMVLVTLACAQTQPAGDGAGSTSRPPLPCQQLVDARAIEKVVGPGFVPGPTELVTGSTSCVWMTDAPLGQPIQIVAVDFDDRRMFADRMMLPAVVPTAAGLYDAMVAGMVEAGMQTEPLANIGERAVATGDAPHVVLFVQRPDGLITIKGTVARATLVEIARVAAAAPPVVVGGNAPTPQHEVAPAEPRLLSDEDRQLPCVQLLTSAEVESAGRPEVLTNVMHGRPGLTYCDWRTSTSMGTGFTLLVAGREEIATRGFADAAEMFAAERKVFSSSFETTPVAGVGDEAFAFMVIPTQPMVIARRGEQVLTLTCHGCSREATVTLGRLAGK